MTSWIVRYAPRDAPIEAPWRDAGPVPGHHGINFRLLEHDLMKFDGDDLHATALTIIGEARGEGRQGQIAVAWVIRNRVEDSRWHDAAADVCFADHQFSVWNDDVNNLVNLRIMAMATWEDNLYRQGHAIAGAVFAGLLTDPTGGATHYHRDSIKPDWADPAKQTAHIGHHIFYAL